MKNSNYRKLVLLAILGITSLFSGAIYSINNGSEVESGQFKFLRTSESGDYLLNPGQYYAVDAGEVSTAEKISWYFSLSMGSNRVIVRAMNDTEFVKYVASQAYEDWVLSSVDANYDQGDFFPSSTDQYYIVFESVSSGGTNLYWSVTVFPAANAPGISFGNFYLLIGSCAVIGLIALARKKYLLSK